MDIEAEAAGRRPAAWTGWALVAVGLALLGGGTWLAWTGSSPDAPGLITVAGGTEPTTNQVDLTDGAHSITSQVVLGCALAALGAALLGAVVAWWLARRGPGAGAGPEAGPDTGPTIGFTTFTTAHAAAPVTSPAPTDSSVGKHLTGAGTTLAAIGAALAWTRSGPSGTTTVGEDLVVGDGAPTLTAPALLGLVLVVVGASLIGAGVATLLARRRPRAAESPTAPTPARVGATSRAAATAVVLVVAGSWLTWTGTRPSTESWFAYAPVSGTFRAPGSVTAELVVGLVLLVVGLLLLGGVAGWTLARRRP